MAASLWKVPCDWVEHVGRDNEGQRTICVRVHVFGEEEEKGEEGREGEGAKGRSKGKKKRTWRPVKPWQMTLVSLLIKRFLRLAVYSVRAPTTVRVAEARRKRKRDLCVSV